MIEKRNSWETVLRITHFFSQTFAILSFVEASWGESSQGIPNLEHSSFGISAIKPNLERVSADMCTQVLISTLCNSTREIHYTVGHCSYADKMGP